MSDKTLHQLSGSTARHVLPCRWICKSQGYELTELQTHRVTELQRLYG